MADEPSFASWPSLMEGLLKRVQNFFGVDFSCASTPIDDLRESKQRRFPMPRNAINKILSYINGGKIIENQSKLNYNKQDYRSNIEINIDGTYIIAKNGIKVAVDSFIVSGRIQRAIEDGSYEAAEVVVANRVINSEDVVLELGAGIGYLSALVMKSIRPKAYIAVEADPRLIKLIRSTHALNDVSSIQVMQAIASSDEKAIALGQLSFRLEDEFWASHVHDRTDGESVFVPTRSLNELISSNSVTVIVADIEGYEKDVFANANLSGVREIMVEVHRRQIGAGGMEALFSHLHREGLFLDGEKSYYNTLVFNRIE